MFLIEKLYPIQKFTSCFKPYSRISYSVPVGLLANFTKPSLKLPEQKLCNSSLHRDSFNKKTTAMSAEEIQIQPPDECLISISLLAIKQNQINKYRDLIGIFGIVYNSKL